MGTKRESDFIEEEYHKLDDALSYLGDKELHNLLKNWYNKLKK